MTAPLGPDPWLSVVVPIHDGEAYLPAALDSVVGEGSGGLEVIAVLDRCSDGSRSILDRYRGRLPLRTLELDAGNWVASTNAGLRAARGRFACFLHQDDLWLPGRLAAVRAALAAAPETTLLLHHARFVDPAGAVLGPWRCPLPPGLIPGELARARLLVQNFVAIPSPVFPREAALAGGGLDEDLWFTADWDLWLRLAGAGPVRLLPATLAAFRLHATSQTSVRTRDTAEVERQLRAVLDRHLGRERPDRDGAGPIRRAAELSVCVNVALARAAHGQRSGLARVLLRFALLGPLGWRRYLRDSRLVERLLPRLRIERRRRA